MLGFPLLYFKGMRLMMFQLSSFYCSSGRTHYGHFREGPKRCEGLELGIWSLGVFWDLGFFFQGILSGFIRDL